MTGQKFEDRKGRTVTVLEIDGSIATLNNGERVAVSRLNDTKFFKPQGGLNESVNPVETTTNSSKLEFDSDTRYEKILNGSISIGDDGNDRLGKSSVIMGRNGRPVTNYSEVSIGGSVVESHNDNLKKLGVNIEDEVVPVTQKFQPQSREEQEKQLLEKYGAQQQKKVQPHPQTQNNQSTKKESISNGLEKFIEPTQNQESVRIEKDPEVNPVHQMFDKAKKVHPIKVNLKINEKIPEKSVIKMMEENFDESAIDYYTKEVYNKLMSDPSIIEDQVRDAIKKYVNSRTKKSS